MTTTEINSTISDLEQSNFTDLKSVLTDPEFDRQSRLLRLQGWRGSDLEAAVRAGSYAHRIAPGSCAALAWVVAFTGSLPIALVTLLSAIIGVFAANHPLESAYNVIARRRGGSPIPPARAGKRLGCFMGTIFFGAASVAFVLDYVAAGRIIVGIMAAVATVVAVTNVCIPSIILTLTFGKARVACPLLITNQ
jgi:hypothetical protein